MARRAPGRLNSGVRRLRSSSQWTLSWSERIRTLGTRKEEPARRDEARRRLVRDVGLVDPGSDDGVAAHRSLSPARVPSQLCRDATLSCPVAAAPFKNEAAHYR